MRKVVIFGLGRVYESSKLKLFSECEILALSDNDTKKHGTIIDGITVIPPSEITRLPYDFIFVTTGHSLHEQISRQLIGLGIPSGLIMCIGNIGVDSYYHKIYGTYTRPKGEKLLSSICRPTDLDTLPWQQFCTDEIYTRYHDRRKLWEFVYIYQSLAERGMLKPENKGLCFAAGREPLPAAFANIGCQITATDAPPEVIHADWVATNQHSDNTSDLYYPEIIDNKRFLKNVSFQYVDMNHIPVELKGYDFLWSSCAAEHIGSIHAAKDFIYRAMDCLKPGGIAVHTVEYTLTSSITTTIHGDTCPFRSTDLIEIAEQLVRKGHCIEPLDFRLDGSVFDYYISRPPEYPLPHFKIPFGGNSIITSFGIIIQKAC